MTNAELIQTIRKEIVNRIDKRRLSEQAKNELVSIISFLDSFEVEEPVGGEFEKEIKDTCRSYWINDYHEQELGKHDIENIARHFAKWGAEHLRK